MSGRPGSGGPVPKREDQRRRRNKPAMPTTKAVPEERVRGPKLTGRHCPVAKRFYDSLRRSGQAEFFQESDWSSAELVVLAIDSWVENPSASLLASIHSMMSSLLVTEGDRRRLRLELGTDDESADEGEGEVAWFDDARRRAATG